jgi:hypothetical protein
LFVLLSIAALSLIAAVTAAARNDAAAGLCAFHETTTVNGTVATATFHVVQDGCTVSLVSIEHFANGVNAVVDTAAGRNLKASATRYTLSVNLRCGVNAETDLVLGEPVLYPPSAFDLQATPFRVACPSAAAPAPAPAPAPAAAATAVALAPAAAAPVVAAPVAMPVPATPVTEKAVPTPTKVGQKPASAKKQQKKHAGVLGVKKSKKNNVKPASAKKKHGGVLGAKKSKNLPFTK